MGLFCNFKAMSRLVITSCTGRKRIAVDPLLRTLPPVETVAQFGSGVDALAKAWVDAISSATKVCQAAHLYAGRSFVDACAVSEKLQGELKIVSAGLGLIGSTEVIPSYELTVSKGRGSVLERLDSYSASTAHWWGELNRARFGCDFPVASSIQTEPFKQIFIALPSRYLEMIRLDLARLEVESVENLRIFTSPAGQKMVPLPLRKAVMPYDERLEDVTSTRRGTRTDFAQRAMRHFVEDIGAESLPLDDAHEVVLDALAKMSHPTKPDRRRVTDDEIIMLLYANWNKNDGQSSRLLRYLRDDALVSCEQTRFQRLWAQVRDSLERGLELPYA
jgi:hypothetical protein